MKRAMFCGVLFLSIAGISSLTAHAADKSDYPILIHVSSSQTRWFQGFLYQDLKVLIDSKHFLLTSLGPNSRVLPVGDYQARLCRNDTKQSPMHFRQYELLLSDGKTVFYYDADSVHDAESMH